MDEITQNAELIEQSGLFDRKWYLSEYPDVTATQLDPIQHFLRYGSHLGRNPGPKFNSQFYLASNKDVAELGINPLLHYIMHGKKEGRVTSHQAIAANDISENIDIIIPVFNALSDVKNCLISVNEKRDGFGIRVIVVNDGSDKETTTWLRSFCNKKDIFRLIENDNNQGYTKALNKGLNKSTAPYVIALNSDTIVTRGWLKGLVRCINSDAKIGIVGPLSNAASWQNVPDLYDSAGSFAINSIPNNMNPDEMAQTVSAASTRSYPRLPFVNGFCFMIRREVIDAIGIMDEKNFPVGYGEENDYCIRASDAGFDLAIADDAYVFHAKSKSFGHNRRAELSKKGSEALKRKHTESKFSTLITRVKRTEPLDKIRSDIKCRIKVAGSKATVIDPMSIKVLFLLPVKGGSGGAHSVVQEATEMLRMGMTVKIAVKTNDLKNILEMYQDITSARNLFIGFDPQNPLTIGEDYDVVVGTIFNSMALVQQIVDVYPHILPAYYVQDYEPLFFPQESDNWHIARDSYTLVQNAIVFAKTHWIANKVKQEHDVAVYKVSPSIDHEVYRPASKPNDGKIHITAMIRPQTPIRGAERTMRVLSRIAQAHQENVEFHLFGCPEDDPRFQTLQQDFDYENQGVLKRPAVASLLARSDIFIDLSDYQAFGRTALEAMACNCAAMVPIHGGTDEYAIDDVNAMMVDSFDEDECFDRLNALLVDRKKLREMKSAGLLTASTFNVHNAAVSEINVFGKSLSDHREHHPIKGKPRLMLMPSRRKDGVPAGSGYVRVLLPYGSGEIRRHWEVLECKPNELPAPGVASVIIIQREANELSLDQLGAWLKKWRATGGKLVYEIDDNLLDTEGLKLRGFKGDSRLLSEKVRWLAQSADVVTVSTPELQRTFLQLNSSVQLIENALDRDLWRIGKPPPIGPGVFRKKAGDPIRIGYIGTPTHDQDLETVAEAMRMIETKYGNKVEIEVIGGFNNINPMFGKRIGLPKNNDYPNFVDWLQRRVHWDIGIIPLADDSFNKSKSYLKFLEYAALELAIVCSDIRPYQSIVRSGENGILVKNETKAWYATLSTLIENKTQQQLLAGNAFTDLMQNHLLNNSTHKLLDVLGKSNDRERVQTLSAIA